MIYKETLENGFVRLTTDNPNGLVDMRTGQNYSEVICKENTVRHYTEA